MSHRSLATFLHHLLAGELTPVGPVIDSATLMRLVEQPAPALQPLLAAHLEALLGAWPPTNGLLPRSIPAATLWVAAALNNAAWAVQRPDPRLLTITLRFTEALPPAVNPDEALAYHSLLRHITQINLAPDWLPVARLLIERSPLTAAWLPRCPEQLPAVLVDLLGHYPVQVALRNRWLALLPDLPTAQRNIPLEPATANAELGRLLEHLLERDAAWQPFVLAFYEADCALQRRGTSEQPTWPVIHALGAAARQERDVVRRRHAQKTLYRYAPLVALMADEACVRPYLYLDGRFLTLIADSVPHKRLKLSRLADRPTVDPPLADS